MKPEELILHVIDELRAIVQAGTEYSALQASRILRQLLIDGYPLIDQANKNIRLKIKYAVGMHIDKEHFLNHPLSQKMTFATIIGVIYPAKTEAERIAKKLPHPFILTRSQFLAANVFFAAGRFISVQQLIEHAAHILGGVHAGEPKNDADRAMNEIHAAFKLNNQPLSLVHLFPLARIVLDALEPLRVEIIRRSSATST